MARTYTVTEYDKDDIEKLSSMGKNEVISILSGIKRGWLPQDDVCSPNDYETYTKSQYEATKLQIAVSKAIEMLEGKEQS